jgi:hypothetical protein
MATNTVMNYVPPSNVGFRIKRPIITTNGFVSDVDPIVKGLLDELNMLLGKRIFDITPSPAPPAAGRNGKRRKAVHAPDVDPDIVQILNSPLTPKHIPPRKPRGQDPLMWEEDSLAWAFSSTAEEVDGTGGTLSEYIDVTADLSALKYAFQGYLTSDWVTLDFNTKTVMDGYPAIVDYLVAYAFHVMNIQDAAGLRNFIYNNRAGVRNIVDYVVVSGARQIINDTQLNVPDYNDDKSDLIPQLKSAGLSLSSVSFNKSALAVIDDHIFNTKQLDLIEHADLGVLPDGIKPQLIKFIKQSPVPITVDNVKFFLPLFISQASGPAQVDTTQQPDTSQSDTDFDITPIADDTSSIQVSRSAILAASQLYYCMVMSDELNVLGAADYFTHKYLLRNGMEIQDPRLRDDLQSYVFSSRFTDLKTNRAVDRTRPAERQMFYRQVFNYGTTQVPEDLPINTEYNNLWKVLMLESARYLEKAQASPYPNNFVSRQNVMQAVEDLQYNLSTNCTGMATVVAPLINAELDFIIQRIFKHKEVLAQIVPAGGTWWKVVEVLTLGMNHKRPKATVLYNKANFGNLIIRSIADYNPTTFERDDEFMKFISTVDAYITTQSILQEGLTDDLKADQEDATKRMPPQTPASPPNGAPVGTGAKSGNDEWDF